MRFILGGLLAAFSCLSIAAVTVTETPGTHDLYKGSSKVKALPTHQACVDAAASSPAGNYGCRNTTTVTVKITAPPQPQGEFQMLSCPSGSVSGATWQQTRDYVKAPAPVYWSAQAWTPQSPPAGACPPPPPPPSMHAGWPVDDAFLALYPKVAGATDIRLTDNGACVIGAPPRFGCPQPAQVPDGTGAFRTVCYRSFLAYYDPIVKPNVDNSSHLHQFFCNDGTRPGSTADTLLTEGGSTARGGAMNKSAVWTPTMIDTLDNSPRPARVAIVYYKTGFAVKHDMVQPIPVGLKMVFGDPSAMSYTRWGVAGFGCDGNAVASDNAEPFVSGQHVIPTKAQCGPGHEVWMTSVAPECWDGVNLDSPDHRSHMAYIDIPWNAQTLPNGCQPHHPILLPQVAVLAITTVGPDDDPGRWVLSSDHPMDASMKGPGDMVLPDGRIVKRGVSAHADYFAHWLPEFQDVWINKCLRPSYDCQAHMLGDGRTMREFGGN